MARPTKQGVDYFSLDVHNDDKLKLIQAKYGLMGWAIVVKLFQHVYSEGYWCQWDEDVALIFTDEIKADHELILGVVDECFRREIFDKHLYEKYKILTSKGIQKRYFEAVKRRKDVAVIPEYLLISVNSRVSAGINSINVCNNSVNVCKSTQTKLKETKLKETKAHIQSDNADINSESEKVSAGVLDNPDIRKINDAGCYELGMRQVTYEFLTDCTVWLKDGMEADLIIRALMKAKDKADNKSPPGLCNYAKTIIRAWVRDGTKTLEQYRIKCQPKQQKKPNNAGNFSQRKYDEEYLNKFYENM